MVFWPGGEAQLTLESIMTCKDMFALALVLLGFCDLGLKWTVLKHIFSEGQSQEAPHPLFSP